MASTKTKAVVALGAIDIARQLAKAYSARQEAERDALGFGAGFRQDAAQLTHRLGDRLPDHLQWGIPPWRTEPTVKDRALHWLPIAAVIAASAAAVVASARWVASHEPDADSETMLANSRVVGAVTAGGKAIDAGVSRMAEGASGAAVGGASAIAAGSSAVKAAAITKAKDELDTKVVKPIKKKVVLYGALALVGLTVYLVLIVGLAQLLFDQF
ncbi:MAG: hypothetical protein JWN72_1419 [Thermoleophilia bacterium]|nr:hypothetical protein [Thermoleophilia bacterium]